MARPRRVGAADPIMRGMMKAAAVPRLMGTRPAGPMPPLASGNLSVRKTPAAMPSRRAPTRRGQKPVSGLCNPATLSAVSGRMRSVAPIAPFSYAPVRTDGTTRNHYQRYRLLSRVLDAYGEALLYLLRLEKENTR